MNIGIFAFSFRKGVFELGELIKNIPVQQIKRMDMPRGKVELNDGTMYLVFTDVHQARGVRFEKVYIDAFLKRQDAEDIWSMMDSDMSKIETF